MRIVYLIEDVIKYKITHCRCIDLNRMRADAAFKMIRRSAKDAGISKQIGNHSFRGTGITNFLGNGDDIEKSQQMTGHRDIRTTKLYDRREQKIQRGEVEKISIL